MRFKIENLRLLSMLFLAYIFSITSCGDEDELFLTSSDLISNVQDLSNPDNAREGISIDSLQQTTYYWYGNEKIPLSLLQSKQFVIIKDLNKDQLKQKINIEDSKILEFNDFGGENIELIIRQVPVHRYPLVAPRFFETGSDGHRYLIQPAVGYSCV